MSEYRPLHDGWTVSAAQVDPVPATVPGCVHTDLLAAGLIPDPYLDDNETKVDWVGRTEWSYQTEFDAALDDPRVDLVCAGLDTVASVTLNGVGIGQTANMHRSYRFPVRELLREHGNQLTVRFRSAFDYAEELRAALGDRPHTNSHPFNFIRKMACNFGWDWGPDLVTAGIWQSIGLQSWRVARLAEVRSLVTVRGGVGRVELHLTVERDSDELLTVTASVGGASAEVEIGAGERTAVLTLTVRDPALWWPRGYGQQPRYPLDVRLTGPGGAVLDDWQRRIGFRTVRLDTTPDEIGERFAVVVNEVPVFVKGVNWIPDDTFVTRVTRERYAARLAQACAANVNYVRVWGGGRYESEDFYDLCDELGLLVGQDFLFACAAYPEESPLADEVAAEAREHVVRLASHPSLVTWTGNNENIWGFHDWGWQERLDGRTWGGGYYFEMLPRIVAQLDPTRPYWAGSPYSGSPDRYPNDPAFGTTHIWDVWNTDDYSKYRQYRPRFVAEFGYQGPPTMPTLRRAISDDPLTPDSPGMAHHQKAHDGNEKLRRGLAAHFPEPADFADWHYLTQVNQARAVALGIEHFRSLWPVCMGTIVWQLNDCWPVTSWAAVDGDGRYKPLWYALRRAYADRLLTIQPRDGGLALVAVNDSELPWDVPATVTRHAFDGSARASVTVGIEVAPRTAVTVPLPGDLATPGDPHAELLRAEAPGAAPGWWFFAEDRDLAYPVADYQTVVSGGRVTVTARSLLRDLSLLPAVDTPVESIVDDALITLLPGESVTFVVSGPPMSEPVLRCVNEARPAR
jgi:beta-mannosidase